LAEISKIFFFYSLGSVSSLVSEKKIFEISANQSILLALAAMLNIRLERKTEILWRTIHSLQNKMEVMTNPNLANLITMWKNFYLLSISFLVHLDQ
jgi:hypothetical protein